LRIKLDENLPAALVTILTGLGHVVDTVADEGLRGRSDTDVWEAARTDDRFFITQDLDFSDIRRFPPGAHPGLLLIRLRQPGRRALTERVRALFEHENVESWTRCFVVASDIKIRIRTPRAPRAKEG